MKCVSCGVDSTIRLSGARRNGTKYEKVPSCGKVACDNAIIDGAELKWVAPATGNKYSVDTEDGRNEAYAELSQRVHEAEADLKTAKDDLEAFIGEVEGVKA